MTQTEWDEWASYHATLNGFTDDQVEMMQLWREPLFDIRATFEEAKSASKFLAMRDDERFTKPPKQLRKIVAKIEADRLAAKLAAECEARRREEQVALEQAADSPSFTEGLERWRASRQRGIVPLSAVVDGLKKKVD